MQTLTYLTFFRYPMAYEVSLNTAIVQEVICYNCLLDIIHPCLKELLKFPHEDTNDIRVRGHSWVCLQIGCLKYECTRLIFPSRHLVSCLQKSYRIFISSSEYICLFILGGIILIHCLEGLVIHICFRLYHIPSLLLISD